MPKKPITLLRRKAKEGDNGHPTGTIGFYGPDNTIATKAVVGIMVSDEAEPDVFRFFNHHRDVRHDEEILEQIIECLRDHQIRSLVFTENIFGCPHEEGTDYPEGEACPQCPFWKDKDRHASLLGEDI